MSDTPVLTVLLDGRRIAEILPQPAGRIELRYNDTWRTAPQAHPLSLSMPLTARVHGERALLPFLWGLLPDNARILRHYARTYGVSERNPVALLRELGADCAGAVQMVPPERAEEYAGPPGGLEAEWVSEKEIGDELRALLRGGTPYRDERYRGRFSLAGAQPKTALLRHEGRWGRPIGRTPTTHILKPPSPDFPGLAENEHLCLQIAQSLGLRAANTSVEQFDGETAIVVERFDRLWNGQSYRRLHQEDTCQAFGVLPHEKYESDGGPGLLDILRFIDESSTDPGGDRAQFLDAAILNWVVAATDAHAKNFSFLHAPEGVRLAPLYDIASYLPYAEPALHRVKLAMRVHREYLVKRIALADWIHLAQRAGIAEELVIARLESICARVPDAARAEAARAISTGLSAAVITPLATQIIQRAQDCQALIARGRESAQ